MRLTPPSFPIFLISLVLVALVIATKYFGVVVPGLTPMVRSNTFETLLAAYGVLLAGVVFKRL